MKPLLQFLSRKGIKRIARWVIPYIVKKIKHNADTRRDKISRRRPKR
jgi:phage-related protein